MPRSAYFEDAFFAVLERTGGRVTQSAELAGVTKQAVYKRNRTDPEFRARFEETRARLRSGNCAVAVRKFERALIGD